MRLSQANVLHTAGESKVWRIGGKSYQPVMPDALYYADAETLLPCRPVSH
jgi:hypothetical protein